MFGNLLNHTGKFGEFYTSKNKKLPIMQMSKMLQNGSKFSILFVGETLWVSLVIIPVYVSMVAFQRCQSSLGQLLACHSQVLCESLTLMIQALRSDDMK
jgi:hypothetical protein